MELGYGSFVEMEWPYFLFIVNIHRITYSIVRLVRICIFMFYPPVTLPQPDLGRITEQVQVLIA